MARDLRPVPTPDPLAWQDHANCLGVKGDLFFPESGASTSAAEAVCAGCSVRDDCLGYALDHNIEFGVWGGTSYRQRKAIRRDRRGDA